ncbi:hypothetical protein AB0I81_29745 [Nonomuraea sp. NPDC050404]|uniref:hypothetical protein n=1 Tax=Nonomuraea sp. NPDC050404 TaxID=3155783 RepID=UPI0033E2D48B
MTRTQSNPSDLARLRSMYNRITEKGLCTGPGADPALWSPGDEPGRNAMNQRKLYEQTAAALCDGCQAITACRVTAEVEEYALLMEKGYGPHGIRAGLPPWVRFDRLLASNKDGNNTEEAA